MYGEGVSPHGQEFWHTHNEESGHRQQREQ